MAIDMNEREKRFMENGGYALLCNMDMFTPRLESTIKRQHGSELFEMAKCENLIKLSSGSDEAYVLTARGQDIRNK